MQKVARRPFECHVCSPVQKCLRFYFVILLWIIVMCFLPCFLETVPYMMFKFVFNKLSFSHFTADFINRQCFYLKIKRQNPQKNISFQLFNTFNLQSPFFLQDVVSEVSLPIYQELGLVQRICFNFNSFCWMLY